MTKPKKVNRYKLSGYIHFILFVVATIILGYIWIHDYNTWLNDVNKTEHDSIRQLIYIFIYMPLLALVYGISEGGKKYRYIVPFITAIVAFLLEYFASDGGKYIGKAVPLYSIGIGAPSFITALVGIRITGIVITIVKAIKSKNKK